MALRLHWLALSFAVAGHTYAQPYPVRPVRLIHGFATGSAIDVMGRPLAAKLSDLLGQQVIVDSRPGATGGIANEAVAKSAPDGYTLLTAPGSSLTAVPHLQAVRFDPLRDFAAVVQTTAFSYMLVAHPSTPVQTARDLIALAKARPGYLTYGSTGVGSGFHLAGEMFCHLAGVKMLHVPYRGGGAAAITDLVGGRVDLMWDALAVVRPQLQSGKLKAVGVTGTRRAAVLPNVPTIAESGLPGYEMLGWHGILAPAATPRDIVDRLNVAVTKALAMTDIRDLWATQNMEILPTTPAQFGDLIRREHERYGKLIKTAGIKLN
jgi:tripartite-type tricarboxylate transporter receptor subunit TctC